MTTNIASWLKKARWPRKVGNLKPTLVVHRKQVRRAPADTGQHAEPGASNLGMAQLLSPPGQVERPTNSVRIIAGFFTGPLT